MDGGSERVLRSVKNINTTATNLDFTMYTDCLNNLFKLMYYLLFTFICYYIWTQNHSILYQTIQRITNIWHQVLFLSEKPNHNKSSAIPYTSKSWPFYPDGKESIKCLNDFWKDSQTNIQAMWDQKPQVRSKWTQEKPYLQMENLVLLKD